MPSSKPPLWVERHAKQLLFSALVVTSITLAVTVSMLTYAYLSRIYQPEEVVPLVTHKSNHMHLYTHSHKFHLPRKNSGLDGDNSDIISSGTENVRPFFKFAKMDDLNLQQIDDYPYERGEIYPGGGNMIIENTSPDEFRVQDDYNPPKKHWREKNFQSGLHEQNAETRQKGAGISEVFVTTEPITLSAKQHLHEPPGNPQPSKNELDSVKHSKEPKIAEHHSQEQRTGESRQFSDMSDTPMTLYHVDNAVKAGAVCLDGSAPAYYHRPGIGNSAKLWIIHFNGGAWCFDEKACFERSQSSLGSTTKLPPSPPIVQGINSPDPTVNPDFYDWNLIWVVYCDGASFTGNRQRPLISDDGKTVYMRGKRVLNAIVNDLLYNRDFKLAEAIILTGSSAGSMTAMFQADYIASKFPKSVPVRVLSDAGFFIDTAPIGGKNLGTIFKKVFELQNSSAGLNQDCIREVGKENGWQCFLPSKSAKYIKTPMFVLNSAYDIWALIYFDGIDCKFPSLEKNHRRKRSVDQRRFLRSDSELDVSWKDNSPDLSMFRREIHNGKFRRDMSGFEMLPFYRNFEPKNTIAVPVPTNDDAENSVSPDFRNSTVDESTKRSDITNSSTNFNSNSRELNRTSTRISTTGRIKEKKKNITSYLKDLGSVTADNDMSLLFHALSANITVDNGAQKRANVSIKENSSKSIKKNGTIKYETKATTNFDKKNVTTSSAKTPNYDQPVVKSVIPSGNETRVTTSNGDLPEERRYKVIKEAMKQTLKSFVKKKSVLQKLDKKRNFNSSLAAKRQDLNKDKARRSTSLAKEYINILRSDPPECTEREVLDALKYRGQLIRATDSVMRKPNSGRFIVSCIDHSLSLFDETWAGMIVHGKSIQQAFGDWFYERGGTNTHDLVDCPYPCNPTCS